MAKEPLLKNDPKPNGHGDPQAKRNELSEAMKVEMKERAAKCRAELDILLKKYNCVLVAQPIIGDDGRLGAVPGVLPQ